MALTVGSRIAHYDVTALIGEGGMGQVYQATDTKLGRQVALKILPEAFATDPDRLARFQREAQVLASLNHPNIAQIHGIEEQDDTRALVLELVEGPTLADRISKGPIPVDEALPIAKQIAEALEAAHEAGVIHRDLKPANIKVREDGTVKVLDFGLAKALDPSPTTDPSQSPTLTAAATQMGVIMGTAAYMSPEQARGKSVDKRADIWSFGVVLYEMLMGSRPFQGDDVSLTLASVMKSDVDVRTLPEEIPAPVRTAIHRCLEKDPGRRIRDIGDVSLAMEGVFDTTTAAVSSDKATAPRLQVWQRPIPLVVASVVLVFIGGLGRGLLPGPSPDTPRVTRFTAAPPGGQFSAIFRQVMALSPDGTRLVYAAENRLYLRTMAQTEAKPLRGTEGAGSPFFSPDGQWVGFWQGSGLRKVSVGGGAPVTLADAADIWGARWEADDSILVGGGRAGIWQVSGEGGTVATLVTVDDGELAASPQMLPGGRWVLFTLRPTGVRSWDDAQIVAQSIETAERKVLIPGGRHARYVRTGHLVYALDDTLLAVPFDVETLAVSPGPVPLVEGVGASTEDVPFTVSDDGTLAYLGGADQGAAESVLGWVDLVGQMTPLLEGNGLYRAPRLSPDGGHVALGVGAEDQDVWLYDIERGAMTRFADEGGSTFPVWTPDGTTITFASSRSGSFDLYGRAADGSGGAELLFETSSQAIPGSWSPDGAMLAFYQAIDAGEDRDLWVLGREGDASLFLATEFDEVSPMVSPDGRWVAYVSDQTGENHVYVQPFPGGGSVTSISTEGGTEPVWSRDGTNLFFRDGARMMAVDVDVEGDTAFTASRPRVLFEGTYSLDPVSVGIPNYDVAADGRFLMIMRGGTATEITVVLNWFQELKERVPVN